MRNFHVTKHACERYLERICGESAPFNRYQLERAKIRIEKQLPSARPKKLEFGNWKNAIAYKLGDCYATVKGNTVVTIMTEDSVESREMVAKVITEYKQSERRSTRRKNSSRSRRRRA